MGKKTFAIGLSLILIICVSVVWYSITNNSDGGTGTKELIERNTGELRNNNTKKEKRGGEKKEFSSTGIKQRDYKNSISDDELDHLIKVTKKYYKNKVSWKVIDYRVADNDHSLYSLYTDYKLGNIIVLDVHTTNNPSGLYRSIAFGRKGKDTKWKVLNEGV